MPISNPYTPEADRVDTRVLTGGGNDANWPSETIKLELKPVTWATVLRYFSLVFAGLTLLAFLASSIALNVANPELSFRLFDGINIRPLPFLVLVQLVAIPLTLIVHSLVAALTPVSSVWMTVIWTFLSYPMIIYGFLNLAYPIFRPGM